MEGFIMEILNAKLKEMLTISLSILVYLTFIFCEPAYGQLAPFPITVKENLPITVTNFTAVYNTGKVYLKWLVKGEVKDGYYLILRSTDGENFKVIGFTEGVGTSLAIEVLYCLQDTLPLQGSTYYQLKYQQKDEIYHTVSKTPDSLSSDIDIEYCEIASLPF